MVPKLNYRVAVLGVAVFLVASAGAWLLLHRCGGLFGCDAGALPLGPVTYEQVASHEEAHLYYPGARVFWRFGGGEERNLIEGGSNWAFAGAILLSEGAPQDLYAWYRQWMLAHGWQPEPTIRATTQVSIEGYHRGKRELFRVAIDDPAALAGTLGRPVPADGRTVFEIAYMILPASSSAG